MIRIALLVVAISLAACASGGHRCAGPSCARGVARDDTSAPRRAERDALYRVELPPNRPELGPSDALVTLVELADFECPFCARVQPTLAALRRRYGDNLRIVFLNYPLPFHETAMPAALAAREAYEQGGNEKFWAMAGLLFEHREELERGTLEALAEQVGLDVDRFRRALDTGAHRPSIDEDLALARRFGAAGTPSFFVNGRFMAGAQRLEVFTELIDGELRRARALVRSGVSRQELYARAIADGASEAPLAPPTRRPEIDTDRIYRIPLPARPIALGPESAEVTLQIFSDFQCPFCARVQPTLAELRSRYGDRIRIVWRDYPLPFHRQAMPAAIAGREIFEQVGADGFWRFHDLVFAREEELDRELILRFASRVPGVDLREVRAAIDTERHRPAIEAEFQVIRDAGLRDFGTPTTFVNGKIVMGAQPIEVFVDAVESALSRRRRR